MMLIIDCQTTGISGDMLLASLVDLGADGKRIIDALYSCQDVVEWLRIREISFSEVSRSGFRAMMLNISYSGDGEHERSGSEVHDAIVRCCDHLALDGRARAFALKSIDEIIRAEARIHREDRSHVHLHEISSADTIVDIVGTALALQDLRLLDADVYATRVAVGGGYLTFSHGTVSNPASAILEIFKGRRFTLVGGPVEHELTTPTGAAMLVSLAEGSVDNYPAFECVNVGYGAGMHEFTSVPNVLKVVLGRRRLGSMHGMLGTDSVLILETNIDDVEGEHIGNMVERLMESSARDVSVVSAIGKKGRPSYILRVICDSQSMGTILDIIFKESGTLGVRVQECMRYVLPREIISVPMSIEGREFNVRAKVVRDGGGRVVYIKAEHDDVAMIARALGMPYRLAHSIINKGITSRLIGDSSG